MDLKLVKAAEKDRQLLITMNHYLMEDEKFDRQLGAEELDKRWDEFLVSDKIGVYLFICNSSTAGYAVVHLDRNPLYIRHFYISRDRRRQGIGTKSFHLLLEELGTETVDLDVMIWNERGYGFWQSLGFKERCRMLTYKKVHD